MAATIVKYLRETMTRVGEVHKVGAFLSLAVELDIIRHNPMYEGLSAETKSIAEEYVQVTRRLIGERIDCSIETAAKAQNRTTDEVYQTEIQAALDNQYGVVALGTLLEAAYRGTETISVDFLVQTAGNVLSKSADECTKKVPVDLAKPYVEDDIAEVLVDALQKMHFKSNGRGVNSRKETIQMLDESLSDIGGTQGLKVIGRAGGLNKILGIIPITHHKDMGVVCQLTQSRYMGG